MQNNNSYDYAIDDEFIKLFRWEFFMLLWATVQMIFFSYFVFTSKAWAINILGISVSMFYLPPVLIAIPNFVTHLMIIKIYGLNSFKKVTIIDNQIIGKNIINQTISMVNPQVADWDFYIKKNWLFSKKDPHLKTSFIKLTKGDKYLFIPHTKADLNFIRDLERIQKHNNIHSQ